MVGDFRLSGFSLRLVELRVFEDRVQGVEF